MCRAPKLQVRISSKAAACSGLASAKDITFMKVYLEARHLLKDAENNFQTF
jgi:hypothetical protein